MVWEKQLQKCFQIRQTQYLTSYLTFSTLFQLSSTNPFAQPAAPTNPFKAQTLNYGSMDQGPGGQFGYTNHVVAEAVQPESRDTYMHDPQGY